MKTDGNILQNKSTTNDHAIVNHQHAIYQILPLAIQQNPFLYNKHVYYSYIMLALLHWQRQRTPIEIKGNSIWVVADHFSIFQIWQRVKICHSIGSKLFWLLYHDFVVVGFFPMKWSISFIGIGTSDLNICCLCAVTQLRNSSAAAYLLLQFFEDLLEPQSKQN